jgi:hypothetical protein
MNIKFKYISACVRFSKQINRQYLKFGPQPPKSFNLSNSLFINQTTIDAKLSRLLKTSLKNFKRINQCTSDSISTPICNVAIRCQHNRITNSFVPPCCAANTSIAWYYTDVLHGHYVTCINFYLRCTNSIFCSTCPLHSADPFSITLDEL